MPYSGPGDDSLPSNVKKLPPKKRAQWVEVFNQTYRNCLSDNKGGGAGGQRKCEGMAFRFANGVAKKELEEMQQADLKAALEQASEALKAIGGGAADDGEKCEQPIAVITQEAPPPYGGATSFAELDEFLDAQQQTDDIERQTYQFQTIINNILGNDEMEWGEKAAAIGKAAEEIAGRVADPPKPPWRKELVDKAKELFGVKAATKSEDGKAFPAADYAYVPDGEKPSGWKLRLTESPGKVTVAQVGRAITALQPSGFRGQKVQIPSGAKGGVVSKISGAIGKIAGASDEQKASLRKRLNAVKEAASAFTLTKDKAGNLRWLTITSNRYYDRDEEVFPEATHKEAVAQATTEKSYPELWLWHTPGSRIGVGDWCEYADGFRFDSGTIDPGMDGVALKVVNMPDLGVSHGFSYVREGDTYMQYKTHEVSPLPRRFAANPWTGLMVDKEDKEMAFGAEKRGFLVDTLGEDKVAQIEEGAEQLKQELEKAGATFKDLLPEDGAGTEKKDDAPGDDATPAPQDGSAVDLTPLTDILQGITTGVSKMQETLAAVQGQIAEQDKAIKELQKTDDEKIAAKASPRRVLRPEDSPANKAGTEVPEDKVPAHAKPDGETPVSAFVDQAVRKLGLDA